MLKADLYTITGKKSGQIDLPKEIFAAKINLPLMAQAVRVYLSNQRKAQAKAKTRGEVRGSGRKIWRQKGTGRARHGDRLAPIFVGGGKAHGPTGVQNYKLKMNKKMKRQSLFSALSSKLKEKEVLVIKGLTKIEPKTKLMFRLISNLPLKDKKTKAQILLVLPERLKNVVQAARNIVNLDLITANQLNTYQVLNSDQLVFMEESIEKLKETFISKEKKGA